MESFFGVVRKKIMGVRFTAVCRRWRTWHLPLRALRMHGSCWKCACLITACIPLASRPRPPCKAHHDLKSSFGFVCTDRESHSQTPPPAVHAHQSSSRRISLPACFLQITIHTHLSERCCSPQIFLPTHSWTLNDCPLGTWRVFLFYHCLGDASVDVKKWDKLEARWSLKWHSLWIGCLNPRVLTPKKTLAHTQITPVIDMNHLPCPAHSFLPSSQPHCCLGRQQSQPSLSHSRGPKMKDAGNPLASKEGYYACRRDFFFFLAEFPGFTPSFCLETLPIKFTIKKMEVKILITI